MWHVHVRKMQNLQNTFVYIKIIMVVRNFYILSFVRTHHELLCSSNIRNWSSPIWTRLSRTHFVTPHASLVPAGNLCSGANRYSTLTTILWSPCIQQYHCVSIAKISLPSFCESLIPYHHYICVGADSAAHLRRGEFWAMAQIWQQNFFTMEKIGKQSLAPL